MKRAMLLAGALLAGAAGTAGTAQGQAEHHARHAARVRAGETVLVAVNGNVVITSTDGSEAEVSVASRTRGDVRWAGNRAPAPYDVELVREDGRLVIRPRLGMADPNGTGVVSIQFGSGSIQKRHEIRLPRTVRLVVRTDEGDVRIAGPFAGVDARNTSGPLRVSVSRGAVSSLRATGRDGVRVNGAARGGSFGAEGTGAAAYTLSSRRDWVDLELTR